MSYKQSSNEQENTIFKKSDASSMTQASSDFQQTKTSNDQEDNSLEKPKCIVRIGERGEKRRTHQSQNKGSTLPTIVTGRNKFSSNFDNSVESEQLLN